ncbi:MAG: hypothetical protein OEZ38_08610, partial [Gammaproteobacteria bacterium]|nr:hypothetical protein [Gammaproteobacteria bacterium]
DLDSWFSHQKIYEFKYSIFLKILFLGVGAMLVLLPPFEFFSDKINYADNEHVAAFIMFLFGFVSLHMGWRSLGKLILTDQLIIHRRFGLETVIDYQDITSISNRQMLMSLKIASSQDVIFIEKQISDYDLVYELLLEKVPLKLEPELHGTISLPLVIQTSIRHYYFLIFLCMGAVLMLLWQAWSVYVDQQLYDIKVVVIAFLAILFSIVLSIFLYIRAEFTKQGITISTLRHKNLILKEHIVHLGLQRQYEKDEDPSYDLTIEYLDIPVAEASEDTSVYTQTISGNLLDVSLEPVFDLLVREYQLDNDD